MICFQESPTPFWGGGRRAVAEFDVNIPVSLRLSQNQYFYRKSLELATGEIDRIHLELIPTEQKIIFMVLVKKDMSFLMSI